MVGGRYRHQGQLRVQLPGGLQIGALVAARVARGRIVAMLHGGQQGESKGRRQDEAEPLWLGVRFENEGERPRPDFVRRCRILAGRVVSGSGVEASGQSTLPKVDRADVVSAVGSGLQLSPFLDGGVHVGPHGRERGRGKQVRQEACDGPMKTGSCTRNAVRDGSASPSEGW